MDRAAEAVAAAPSAPSGRARAGIARRLYRVPALHRLLPGRVAILLAILIARLRWHLRAAHREEAIALRALILLGTEREADAQALARRGVLEHAAQLEVAMRLWAFKRARIEGLERFQSALGAGRGVLLTSAHLGPLNGVPRVLALRGHEIHVPVGEWALGGGFERRSERIGMHLMPRGGSYAALADLLRAGGIVFLPFDVPGGARVRYLGKPALVASGSASIAFETGAMVVPAFAGRAGRRPWLRVQESIDPRDFADAQSLRQHLAEVVERAVLARPEAMSTVFARHLWPEASKTFFGEPTPAGPPPRS
jgi:lauroyl/myristoyl acyltransferase